MWRRMSVGGEYIRAFQTISGKAFFASVNQYQGSPGIARDYQGSVKTDRHYQGEVSRCYRKENEPD
jgi:hypothetical protein